MKIKYYGCKVIEDIKGNFRGDDRIEVCVGDNLRGFSNMELGTNYLVLLRHESQNINFNELIQSYTLNPYGTNRYGILKIDNNVILNMDRMLPYEGSVLDIILNLSYY